MPIFFFISIKFEDEILILSTNNSRYNMTKFTMKLKVVNLGAPTPLRIRWESPAVHCVNCSFFERRDYANCTETKQMRPPRPTHVFIIIIGEYFWGIKITYLQGIIKENHLEL